MLNNNHLFNTDTRSRRQKRHEKRQTSATPYLLQEMAGLYEACQHDPVREQWSAYLEHVRKYVAAFGPPERLCGGLVRNPQLKFLTVGKPSRSQCPADIQAEIEALIGPSNPSTVVKAEDHEKPVVTVNAGAWKKAVKSINEGKPLLEQEQPQPREIVSVNDWSELLDDDEATTQATNPSPEPAATSASWTSSLWQMLGYTDTNKGNQDTIVEQSPRNT